MLSIEEEELKLFDSLFSITNTSKTAKKKYSKSYYAQAAKKSRQKKRQTLQLLKKQNCLYEQEMPFLKHKANKLRSELFDRLDDNDSNTLECLRSENAILRREIKKFRILSSQAKKMFASLVNTQYNLSFSTIFNQNLYFMMHKVSKLIELSKITLPQLEQLEFSSPKLEWIKKLLPYAEYGACLPDNIALPKLVISCCGREIRFPSLTKMIKIEVNDIPVPYQAYARIWRELISNDKLCWIMNLYITNLTHLVSIPNPTPIQRIDNSAIGSYENFETNARKVYHNKDEAVFLAASHSTKDEEYIASFFMSSLEVELCKYDSLGTSLFHGGKIKRGKSVDFCDFVICMSLREGSCAFGEDVFKPVNEKLESFEFFQFMKKHYDAKYALDYTQTLIELCIVLFRLRSK